ncbi:MAG: proline racemase family protein [Acidimicrobiales bacterium]
MTFDAAAVRRLTAVEVHAEGEPGRVITEGVPDIPGKSVFDKMRWLESNADDLRLRMLREPRGYPGLCCNLLVPPGDPAADAGFIIMEQTEYPPMSGSNTICVVTALLETGMIEMIEPLTELTLEAPAGLIGVRATCVEGKVTAVTFRNVPAFVMHLDVPIDVPELGEVMVDIAWGGMFYAIADGDALGIDLSGDNGAEIARASEMIRVATAEQMPVTHPITPELAGPSISQLTGAATVPGASRRNAVTVATGSLDWDRPATWTGALDRCPCGTGTSATMAVRHARGELSIGEEFVHEGPLGTTFTGRLVEETTVGPYAAVVPEITGQGWIIGRSEWLLDPTDPFPAGFRMGDIW